MRRNMIRLQVLTLIVSCPNQPSVLVLGPVENDATHLSPDGVFHNSRVVPIWIGSNEAAQFSVALEHARLPRPITHDLFLDALTNLDARIDHVLIYDAKGSVFFAKLIIRQAGRLIELDARPSDALALAIRQEAPFYITEDVLERSSFPYVFKDEKTEDEQLAEFKEFIEQISPEDFEE